MASTGTGLTRKLGPLPIWAWGLLFGVGGYLFYRQTRSSGSQASPTGTVLDPNAIDPNTGLTYGQEESAALNANATSPSAGGLAGSSGAGSGGLTGTGTLSTELTDLGTIFGLMQQLDPNLGQVPSPPNSSNLPTLPVLPTNPPPTTPTVHNPVPSPLGNAIQQQLLTSTGLAGQAARGWIAYLVSKGFAHPAGQPGVLVKGNQKYFIFQLGGQTHIREAIPTLPAKPKPKPKPKPKAKAY